MEKRPLEKTDMPLSVFALVSELDCDFVRGRPVEQSSAHLLRITLTVPGVHTASVGYTKPRRRQENASWLYAGPLSQAEFTAIRKRGEEIAPCTWVGQT